MSNIIPLHNQLEGFPEFLGDRSAQAVRARALLALYRKLFNMRESHGLLIDLILGSVCGMLTAIED